MNSSTPGIEIDASNFFRMLESLQQLSGKDFQTVLLDRTAHVLKNCLAHTPAAKEGVIIKRVSAKAGYVEFAGGEVIATWKKAGYVQMFLDDSNFEPSGPNAKHPRKAPRLVNGKSWHEMDPGDKGGKGKHWSNQRWGKFQALLEQAKSIKAKSHELEKALAARGLTKQTWLQCAQDLGIDAGLIGAPGYVQSAQASNGQQYKVGFGKVILEAAACYIEVVNEQYIITKKLHRPSGAEILQLSIDATATAFDIDVQKGVFDGLKLRAKRYPGIFTDP